MTVNDPELTVLPSAGEEMLSVGGVRSMFTIADAVLVLPALSVAVPLIATP